MLKIIYLQFFVWFIVYDNSLFMIISTHVYSVNYIESGRLFVKEMIQIYFWLAIVVVFLGWHVNRNSSLNMP